jgi:CelD/BcsL family acetyltransferase involved in cellulose biosynthesis
MFVLIEITTVLIERLLLPVAIVMAGAFITAALLGCDMSALAHGAISAGHGAIDQTQAFISDQHQQLSRLVAGVS